MILYKYLIGFLLLVILAGGTYWKIQSDRHERDFIQANNDLAALFPLKHINDSLAVKVTRLGTELEKEINAKSQLRRILTDKDQRIIALVAASQSSRADTVRIQVRERVGVVSYFDSTNRWFQIAGWYDTTQISLQAIEFSDSLTFAIAEARNHILYGYVQNHSPYSRIGKADFAIDLSTYQDKPSWVQRYSPYVRAIALSAGLFDTKRRELWAGAALGFTILEVVF
jgi:hypothetical protein